ncbi:MAG: NfeD family protein, partial [Acetobacteraceae bacterium]
AFAAPFGTKVVVFLVLLAAGIAASLALRRRQRVEVRVNTPDAGLVGRIGTLTERHPSGARVRLGDSDWSARVSGEAAIGDAVRVEGVDGTTLVVRRAGPGSPSP